MRKQKSNVNRLRWMGLAAALIVLLAGLYYFTGSNQKKDRSVAGLEGNYEEMEEDGEYDGPGHAAEFDIERTRNPHTGRVPWAQLRIAIEQTEEAKQLARSSRTALLNWQERGPNGDFFGPQGNTRPAGQQTSGRVRAIMVDSLDPSHKTVFVGSVAGGLWKTTDITASPANWTLINDFMTNLAIADICQDPRPGFQNIMYLCTGESYFNADAVRGVGVFKSTDAGATWTFLPSTSTFLNGTRILCDHLGNVYLGSRGTGLQRSTDGGTTWTNISPTGLPSDICDLEITSTATLSRMFVVTGINSTMGIRFTDNPSTVTSATWTAPATPIPTANNRCEIAVSGSTLYALPCNASGQVPNVYKSVDAGNVWTISGATPTTVTGSPFTNTQGWYDLSVAINPSNANECIIGGIDCAKTTNGGTNFTRITAWVGAAGPYVHADQHELQWYDGGSKLIFGCDGGIHYSTDGGATTSDRNKGLRIKQFYSVAIHPLQTNYFIAGAQDNGMHRLDHPGLDSSIEVYGGDGMYAAIDQDQPQYQFGAAFNQVFRRTTNNGATWSTPVSITGAGRFVNPWDYDNTANIIYSCNNANTFMRWNNPQTGNSTEVISTPGFAGGNVSAVHVSPYTAHRVFFGTGIGGIFIVDNANTGTTATATAITPAGASGFANCVVTGSSEQNLMAAYSSYGVTNVWVSTNGGTSWTACDGNLPDMPVRWALFHPDDNTKAFIATETGVWETEALNGASTVWTANPSFPNVRTDMIKYRASDRLIAAGTHGRGIWTANIPPAGGFTFDSPGPVVSGCPAPTTMTATLTATFLGGFSNPVSLSASGAPAGTNVSFGTNPLTPGAPSSTVNLNNANTLAPGSYTIQVTGTASGAANQVRDIVFTINPTNPAITGHPSNQTICAGDNTSFSIVSATATSFQWEESIDGGGSYNNVTNGGVYSGATTATLSLTGVPAGFNNYRYRCRAISACGTSTSNAAILTVNSAASITGQPSSATVCAGTNHTFSVTAAGTSLNYQWHLSTDGVTFNPISNGGVYSGATTANLLITGVLGSMNGYQYRVVVTGSGACSAPVTSNIVTLTVVTPVNITGQPANQTICENANTSFSVTATGTSPTYQWQLSTDGGVNYNNISNGGVYSGATTATLQLTGVPLSLNNNRYRVNVTNSCGTSTSTGAILTVNAGTSITAQPSDATVCTGSNHTFNVTATGTGLTYQWHLSTDGVNYNPISNGGVYSGATTASLTITGVLASMDGYRYRVVVQGTGACPNPVTSSAAILSIVSSVTITSQPTNQTVCEGGNASFTVAGSGSGIIYQWQVNTGSGFVNVTNGGVYSGATTATLTITGATTSMSGYLYRAQLSNATCTSPGTSNSASLTVNSLPAISSHPANATICQNGNTSFSVTATGTGISYQWQVNTGSGFTNVTNGGVYSGATTATLTITGATSAMNGYLYRVIVTGTCTPAATSNSATLTVVLPVLITADPANREICAGENATFTVTATSTQTIIYQWQVRTVGSPTYSDIPGANSASYTVTGASFVMNGNLYRVVVSNASCTTPVISASALLTVRPLPTVTLTASPLTSLLPGQTTTLTSQLGASAGGVLTSNWLFNGATPVPPIVGNTYVVNVEKAGIYQVRATETWISGLVCSALSQQVTIMAPPSTRLFIFPSPNNGSFTVSYYNSGGGGTQRTIAIFDSKGGKVFHRKFNITGAYTLIPVDMRTASRGIYYVVVGDAVGNRLAEGKVHIR